MDIIIDVFFEALKITLLVLVMMVIIELLNTGTRGKILSLLRGKSGFRTYFISSLMGSFPGCLGGFTNVTLYMHGMISFGALAGSMIAVSGDEAFVMLAMFPKTALVLFLLLFIIGIGGGILIDAFVKKYKIKVCQNCKEMIIHNNQKGFLHFSLAHIWMHIVKKHLWKVFLWTFFALIAVEAGLKYFDLKSFSSEYKIVLLFLSALLGLIPESGPHLIFVTLFFNGLVPFSVLLTSSIVQDGHGMLPLLSFSLRDTLLIKIFNLFIGLTIGLILFTIGF